MIKWKAPRIKIKRELSCPRTVPSVTNFANSPAQFLGNRREREWLRQEKYSLWVFVCYKFAQDRDQREPHSLLGFCSVVIQISL